MLNGDKRWKRKCTPIGGMVGHHRHDKNECVASLSAMNDYYESLAPIAQDRYLGKLLAMGLEEDDPYSPTTVSCHSRISLRPCRCMDRLFP